MQIRLISLFIISFFFYTNCFSQGTQNLVSGIVKNEAGSPIPYVNIWIKSHNNIGTSSDLQGHFIFPQINISIKDTLVFSCVGYYNYYLPVKTAKTHDELIITLKESVKTFEEITVNAKRSTVNDIIKKFNNSRKIYIPENITKFEIFVRQFIKLDNVYYSLLESFFKVISENQNALTGEILYFNKINKGDYYNCHNNAFFPGLDFKVFLDYPKIDKSRRYKYSLDTVMSYNNVGLVYVISESYIGKNSSTTHVESTVSGDIIIDEIVQDTTNANNTGYSVINKYYITDEYKIHKVIYETYFKNARNNEVRENGKVNYRRVICYTHEVEYKEINNKIYPYRMKTIWVYEYSDEHLNHCVTKNMITEYYVSKIEQNAVDDTCYRSDFQRLNFYNLSPITECTYFDSIIIRDDLRKIVINDIEGK